MSNSSESIFKSAMNMGAIAGLIMAAIYTVFALIGWSDSSLVTLFTLATLVGAMAHGIRTYRDRIQGGYIKYETCLGYGSLVTLGASLVMSVFVYAYIAFFAPEMVTEMLKEIELAMYETGSPDDEVEFMMDMYNRFLGPGMMAFSVFFTYGFLGFLAALLVSIGLKKPEPTNF